MATPGPDQIHHLAPDSAGYTSVETDLGHSLCRLPAVQAPEG